MTAPLRMPGNVMQTNSAPRRFKEAAEQATRAHTDIAREEYDRGVGESLGNLNAIGALRSGASVAATKEQAKIFGDSVSRAAASNAMALAQAEADADRADRASAANSALRGAELNEREIERQYRAERDKRRDMEVDRGYERGVTVEDREFGYRGERDARGDFVNDRDYLESNRRYDTDFIESGRRYEKTFGEDQRRYDQDFVEDKRRFDTEREDAKAREKRAGRNSIWGAIGSIGGTVLGSVLGPAGAAAGGAIGQRIAGSLVSNR